MMTRRSYSCQVSLCFLGFDSVLRRAWQGSGGRRHVVGELVDTWESCGMLVGMCMWQYIGEQWL